MNFSYFSYLSCAKLTISCSLFLILTACDKSTPQAVAEQSAKDSIVQTTAPTDVVPPKPVLQPNMSQQFIGDSEIEQRLAKALPAIPYSTDNLSEYAQKVNMQIWQNDPQQKILSKEDILKIQALLNWHHHKVGALDGHFNQNTIKAMQVFQYKNHLPISNDMNAETWQALTQDSELLKRPVFVRYTLTADDVNLYKYANRTAYRTVREAIAERFQMSRELLMQLNPKTSFKAGSSIIVYNPAQPNMQAVTRVIADKKRNILFAYNAENELVASYPTTVGGRNSPSPKGTYKVMNRHIDPVYNKDFKNPAGAIPAGPNNPVGRVWMGLSKRSFGIHGSPEPEMISRQASAGCVRLTNWDALSLFGTIEQGAEVQFVDHDYMKAMLKEKSKMNQDNTPTESTLTTQATVNNKL